MSRNPNIDCSNGWLTALRAPNGLQRGKIPEADHTSLPERGEVTKMVRLPPGIQLLRGTALDHLWASEEVVEAFAIWLGECQGMLGASLDGITEGEGNPRMLNARAGAAAVVAAEEWHSDGAWMTATGSPRHEGGNWTTGVVYCDEPSDPANLGPLPISTLPKHATMQTWLTRIGTDMVNVEMVTDDGGRIPAQYQDFTISRIVVSSWDTRTMWTYAAKIRQLSHRTVHGIQRVFVRKSDFGSRSVGRVWEEMTR